MYKQTHKTKQKKGEREMYDVILYYVINIIRIIIIGRYGQCALEHIHSVFNVFDQSTQHGAASRVTLKR